MLLNLQIHNDTDITPFVHNGIIIDTSVFKIIVDGVVCTRFSKKKSEEFTQLLSFLDLIKMNNRWDKFFITPHVLTEICTHLRNDYRKWKNYKEIVEEIIPILKAMEEKNVKKDIILNYIDLKIPIVELGDISICLTANNFIACSEKVAILTSDNELNKKYQDSRDIMVMDFRFNICNLS